ncbi:uncharacterized protein LOC122639147 isoform X2 [Telopea speciosissima]|uniref:uncharacterized protein LOC122639147 isoform X2 n=1 Tax=Telopea speciosissima TaxID=54955 RepID=UPI001CC5FCE8|nr:uncharacterized protein LOC122639147 isoform X2 [Telopea speciosissima]
MAGFLVLLPAFFTAAIALSGTTPPVSRVGSATICGDQNNDIICELQQMKLKIAHMESVLEESVENLNAKSLHLKEQEKLIEEMKHKIHSLQTALISMKGDSSFAEEKINALEEKVQLLWDASRKNNFNMHILETKARDAEKRLEVVSSQVEKMTDIVTEQWIQIQQLEQALLIATRNLKAQKANYRCTFLKVLGQYSFVRESFLSSYTSQALHQLKKTISAAKIYHHELQGFVKQEMERNEFTAVLANKEVIFFVASALIIFPIMGAWTWLSSCFS